MHPSAGFLLMWWWILKRDHQNSILILTDKGLGKICFNEMTLHDKAMYYEQQVGHDIFVMGLMERLDI